jgi:FKBP-type peptidyl-prolyl cis-trans isomerase SlyD
MKPQIISFRCVLKNKTGTVISSTFNREVITHCPGDPLPGLSEGLHNLKAGEKRQIILGACQAYGFYDLNLVMEISRKKISRGMQLKIGDEILLQTQEKKLRKFRVIQENSKTVTLDGNHPLAGQDLIFYVEGVQARDATQEEIAESRVENFTQGYH